MMEVFYEVNIGGVYEMGTVFVPNGASDDDIRLSIMEDLYEVTYIVKKR